MFQLWLCLLRLRSTECKLWSYLNCISSEQSSVSCNLVVPSLVFDRVNVNFGHDFTVFLVINSVKSLSCYSLVVIHQPSVDKFGRRTCDNSSFGTVSLVPQVVD